MARNHLLATRIGRSKTNQPCRNCDQTIPAGEKHRRYTAFDGDGALYVAHAHLNDGCAFLAPTTSSGRPFC